MIRPTRFFGQIALIVGCLVAAGSEFELRACSCIREKPVCESVGSTAAIFVGKVVGAKQQIESDGKDYDVGEIYFEVIEPFTGIKAETKVTISSGTGGGDCGYWFKRGETYLVYAYGADTANLSTGICTRTRPLDRAADDLEYLRKLPAVGSGIRIFGKVTEGINDPFDEQSQNERPIEGVKLKVQHLDGTKKLRQLITDADGRYEIAGIPAGRYQITPAIPRSSKINEYSLEPFEVKDRGCRERSFYVQNDSRIVGRVVDSTGNPLKKIKVELLPAYGKQPLGPLDETTWTEDDGSFEFYEVPVGSYILAVNHLSAPDEDAPFPATYYPRAPSRSAAQIIEIRAGKSVDGLKLQMPDRLPSKQVTGRIVWPDGSPAANAEVHLEDRESLGWCVNGCSSKADEKGEFSLTGYSGRRYRLRASLRRFENGDWKGAYAPMPTFSIDTDKLVFTLVLNLDNDPAKVDEPE